MSKKLLSIVIILTTPATLLAGENERGWFIRPYFGLSQVDDVSTQISAVNNTSGVTRIQPDDGFVSGVGIGYQYNAQLASEIAWEYRTNDINTDFSGSRGGDYASNAFYLNGYYHLPTGQQRWQPYVGGGLGWLQEIDLDLETANGDVSLSDSGQVGYQLFAGVNYPMTGNWQLQAELRYADFGEVDLDEEGGSGKASNLEYQPLTVQLGVKYRF
ncbi:MAG: OmpW family outer membrane protein [Thiolinea sp.]